MYFLFDDQILFSEYICKTHFRQKEEKKTIYLPGTSASYLSPQINQIAEKVCKEILVWKISLYNLIWYNKTQYEMNMHKYQLV